MAKKKNWSPISKFSAVLSISLIVIIFFISWNLSSESNSVIKFEESEIQPGSLFYCGEIFPSDEMIIRSLRKVRFFLKTEYLDGLAKLSDTNDPRIFGKRKINDYSTKIIVELFKGENIEFEIERLDNNRWIIKKKNMYGDEIAQVIT